MQSYKNQTPLIVTGLSGAGMSSCLKHLEDLGYEVFDNFPISLVNPLLEEENPESKPVAIGIDTRTRGFSPEALLKIVEKAKAKLLFICADETILQKRFTETRRRHPLAQDRPASAGIKKEQEWLFSLRDEADDIIDTSQLSIHELRQTLENHYKISAAQGLTITLMSFGYKHAVPRDADLVFDVRFLKNPHWIPELKEKTGKNEEVGTYIEMDAAYKPFLENFKNLLSPLLPRYSHEGKSYLTIAIGCTGGKHRSVYTVEKLHKWLKELGYENSIFHRDIER